MKMEADCWLAFNGYRRKRMRARREKAVHRSASFSCTPFEPAKKLYTVEAGAEKLGAV